MIQYLLTSVLPTAIGVWLVLAARDRLHAAHVGSLRRQLGPGTPDLWTLRCTHCHGRLRTSQAYVVLEQRADGTVTRAWAWHSDRPACSTAFTTDDRVLSRMSGQGPTP